MNTITIKYSFFSKAPEVLINNEPLSPYSDLSSVMNNSFLGFANVLFESFDNEIYDEYTVEFFGSHFQYHILEKMSIKSEYCKAINHHKMESIVFKDELLSVLSGVCDRNNISKDNNPLADVYIDPECDFKLDDDSFNICSETKAELGILSSDITIPNTIRYPIVLSDNFDVRKNGKKAVYIIPKTLTGELKEYIEYEFDIVPRIVSMLTALKYANLSAEDKAILDYYCSGNPSYILENEIYSLDKGESSEIKFYSFPEGYYTLISTMPNVVNVNGNTLSSINSGTSEIAVIDKEGAVQKKFSVTVIEHNFIENIKLIPRFEYLKKNDRNIIDIVIYPQNAEDINEIEWSISDNRVASVDNNGNIIALGDGKARITVKSRKAQSTLTIEVKPTLQRMYFSNHSIRLKSREIIVLECRTEPENAPVNELQWDLDNRNIASINPSRDGLKCQIAASATYEGKGNVRCYDPNTKLGAICNIEVVSKVKANSLGKAALACLLIGLLVPFLLPVSTITSIAGLATDHESDHKPRYVVCLIFSLIISFMWLAMINN